MTVAERRRRDRGAADALGLVLLAPAIVGLALLVVSLGRRVEGRAQVQTAAEAAAQAAALERSPAAARAAARQVTDAMLTDPDLCADPYVFVDDGDFRAGGSVTVTVGCSASRRAVEQPIEDVGDAELRYVATAVAHIDEFRATEAAP